MASSPGPTAQASSGASTATEESPPGPESSGGCTTVHDRGQVPAGTTKDPRKAVDNPKIVATDKPMATNAAVIRRWRRRRAALLRARSGRSAGNSYPSAARRSNSRISLIGPSELAAELLAGAVEAAAHRNRLDPKKTAGFLGVVAQPFHEDQGLPLLDRELPQRTVDVRPRTGNLGRIRGGIGTCPDLRWATEATQALAIRVDRDAVDIASR